MGRRGVQWRRAAIEKESGGKVSCVSYEVVIQIKALVRDIFL